ncbi:MAG: LCP family protein [Actinomycetota bacterium]
MYDGLKNLDVPRRRPRGAKRALKAGLVVFLVLSVGFVGTQAVTFLKVRENIRRGQDKGIDVVPPLPKGPMNILVLGSDRRDVVDDGDRNARQFKGGSGQRADTIMLIHMDADGKKAVVVSFPRDLRVKIPGRGTGKINSAYTFGGPNLMIKTVSQLTGSNIHHYVEVNFDSFRTIVNAVGGVTVYFDEPVSDRRSGLEINQSGCVKLDGDMALSFVRARHIYASADLGRIQTQQRFIRVLLGKVKGVSFLLNPGKVTSLSRAVGNGLRYDTGVDLGLARAIANKLAGFDQKRIDFRMYPGTPQYVGGVSYVVANERQASALFEAIEADADLPPYGKTSQSVPEPADVSLKIMNGTGENGLAGRQAVVLRKLGYRIRSTGTADVQPRTVITYVVGDELKAELVRKQYPGSQVKIATSSQSVDVVVTIGTNFLKPPPSPGAKPPPSKRPTPEKSVIDTTCRQ